MVTIETPRLILRRWIDDDVAAMARINADPEVMRWISDGTTRTEGQTRGDVRRWEAGWDEHGFGLFAAQERSTEALIGFVGLAVPTFLPEVLPAVEIGWRLARSSWGRGLATEGARAVLTFAFDDCGLDRLVSIAQVGNDASIRIMTKLGMHLAFSPVDPSTGRALRVYEISAPTAPSVRLTRPAMRSQHGGAGAAFTGGDHPRTRRG